MPTTQIMVVDDDEAIRASLRRGLAFEGYQVALAADGEEALLQARVRMPDLVVLDLLLPGVDGLEICRRLRAAEETLPIVLLTARDAVADRVIGLETGADDYLVKPFAFEELLARIRVCLRRREPGGATELRFSDVRLDAAAHEAFRGETPIELTATEYDLLRTFLLHPRQVLTREVIHERVWGYDFGPESRIVDVYVHGLREKLEADGRRRLIQTVRGVGYVLREKP